MCLGEREGCGASGGGGIYIMMVDLGDHSVVRLL